MRALTSNEWRILLALVGALLTVAGRPHLDPRTALQLMGVFAIGIAVGARS